MQAFERLEQLLPEFYHTQRKKQRLRKICADEIPWRTQVRGAPLLVQFFLVLYIFKSFLEISIFVVTLPFIPSPVEHSSRAVPLCPIPEKSWEERQADGSSSRRYLQVRPNKKCIRSLVSARVDFDPASPPFFFNSPLYTRNNAALYTGILLSPLPKKKSASLHWLWNFGLTRDRIFILFGLKVLFLLRRSRDPFLPTLFID